MSKKYFRFQDLEIWNRSSKISIQLFEIADDLEKQKKFRFAEQLRGATLSITNNIAEGSGSNSNIDFQRFLNYSRKSVFEVANMLMMLVNNKDLTLETVQTILDELVEISKMISGFSKSLNK